MNRDLVASLFGSLILALAAFAIVLMLGGGWILAVLAYLGTGSIGLVVLSVALPAIVEHVAAASAVLPVPALFRARIG